MDAKTGTHQAQQTRLPFQAAQSSPVPLISAGRKIPPYLRNQAVTLFQATCFAESKASLGTRALQPGPQPNLGRTTAAIQCNKKSRWDVKDTVSKGMATALTPHAMRLAASLDFAFLGSHRDAAHQPPAPYRDAAQRGYLPAPPKPPKRSLQNLWLLCE